MTNTRTWTDRIDTLKADVRFAVRTLAKNPVFTTVAVLTLALGIGMNSAIFSVVNGVLLKPLPYLHPEQLLRVWQVDTANGVERRGTASAMNLDDWRARQRVFTDIAGYFYAEGMSGTDLMGVGEPTRVSTAFISPGFWKTLGVSPQIGRIQHDDEMVRGSNDKVIVLTYAFWQRQFGGATSVLGRRVSLGDGTYEIVGVMPPSFKFPQPSVEMYIPFSTIPDDAIPRLRFVRTFNAIGRMKPRVTLAQANADINSVTRSLAEQFPEDKSLGASAVAPLQEAIVGNVRTSLLILLGAVAFVLLIAAVNLASLMLARATTREREFAIRVALGAERGRVVRQLFTESLVLAAIGGALGVLLAQVGARALVGLAGSQLPRADEIGIDYRVLGFTAFIAILSGVAFGLVPAIRASSPELQQTLREGTRGSTGAHSSLRSALVIAEIALAMVLVVGAGLMTRSFVKLLDVDLGFTPEHRLAVNLSISMTRHATDAEAKQTYRAMLDKVRAIPGVLAAGSIRDLPFHGDGEEVSFTPQGMTGVSRDGLPSAPIMFTSDGFFSAMGIKLLAGRDLSPNDNPTSPTVMVVNQALAKKYFTNENAVGKTIALGPKTTVQIVGVVGDVHQRAVDETPAPRMYLSAYQLFRLRMNIVVRTQGEPALMTRRITDAIHAVDPQQPITSTFTLDDAIGEAVARPRLITVLLALFGAMGLVLGALGIYGVLAYLVNQRTREIGVRLALGAQSRDVMQMVVGRGVALAGIGVVIGLVCALVLTRLMRGVLYDVSPSDPLTFGGVALALFGVATLASWLPALRATRVDPLVALRSE
jgi:predicted permease